MVVRESAYARRPINSSDSLGRDLSVVVLGAGLGDAPLVVNRNLRLFVLVFQFFH